MEWGGFKEGPKNLLNFQNSPCSREEDSISLPLEFVMGCASTTEGKDALLLRGSGVK